METSRARQRSPCPLLLLGPAASRLHVKARCSGLSWKCLVNVRAWCRARVGAIVLTHRCGKRSQARNQHCIFCSGLTSSPYTHVLMLCPAWQAARQMVLDQIGIEAGSSTATRLVTLLSLEPGDCGFEIAVQLLADVDRLAAQFWRDAQVIV
jgi:hypothetical protein